MLVEMDITLGQFEGSTMNLAVLTQERTIALVSDSTDTSVHLAFNVDIPNRISFVVSNKSPGETKLDADNQIIEDKFVRVDRMTLDRMPVDRWILESRMFDFDGMSTNYFSYNGTAAMTIPFSTSFEFFLDLLTNK